MPANEPGRPDEDLGSAGKPTDYVRRRPRRGSVLSGWAVLLVGLFLLLAVGGLFLWPKVGTSPAPAGTTGSGIATTPPPAQKSD